VVSAEVVVAAIGVIPNVQWLDGSGLKIKLGVICDESGLAAPGIVAAGDVAAWYDPRFGEPCHIEHWDNAVRQAVRAAQRLLQKTPSYPDSTLHTVPWFWSDQYGRKIQVTGSTRQFDEVAVFRATDGAEKVIALFRRGQKLVAAFGLNVGRHILEYRRLLLSDPEWDLVKTDTRLRAYRESSA
jgi:3-phenylpropionate/trans-cinnamate dioxygenase ferredoxin reductase subunit